jgi:thiol:disulfide interchange protein
MSRVRRAHYGALLGVALVVTALLVTVGGAWPDVQSVLGVVMAVLSVLLVLKALSILGTVGLRSLL